MCGLTGVMGGSGLDESVLRRMIGAIRHRGPDDSGVWIDREVGVGLGHARLSILDLSEAGHQPMISHSGRFAIAFNGEIYNHEAIRAELVRTGGAPAWRGHSDTETLLAGFDRWGIEATVTRATGMFAFAVWDRSARELTLARDRVGEKPMYFGWQNDAFLFGSELGAIKAHPAFRGDINRDALTQLMRHNYIPAPYSIYHGISKLLPGTMVTVAPGTRNLRHSVYWDIRNVIASGAAHPFQGSPGEAVTALEDLLREAVRKQMVADVPLGAFLSGGVDSSTIVALMQEVSSRPVRTFTIGFQEARYNEAEHAKAVAGHLGTEHTELYVSPQQMRDVIPMLPALYSEPFSDSSQIPTFLVSRLARREVTVSLSGDGGDELFAGYNRYVLAESLWGKIARVPRHLRSGISKGIAMVPAHAWDRLLRPIQPLLPRGLALARTGEQVVKGGAVLGARTPADLYRSLVSHWSDPGSLVIGGVEPPTLLVDDQHRPGTGHFVHDMMALDLLTYLPDDILAKVDRAAMGVSLETRVPFLDHQVVEFAWSLPLDYKLKHGVSKWPLRQILDRHVPRELTERPKMGFGVPIDSWLRGPLRDWAEDLLSEGRLRQEGYFHAGPIRAKWSEHIAGKRNWQYHLWDVLMFQAWLAEAT